tara:strand:+ start:156 stop:431 length:276 start_codon:yes stop_codon:yes gene_type:complete
MTQTGKNKEKKMPKKNNHPPKEVLDAIGHIFDQKLSPQKNSISVSRKAQKTLEEFHALPKEEQESLIQEQIASMYNYTVKVELKAKDNDND